MEKTVEQIFEGMFREAKARGGFLTAERLAYFSAALHRVDPEHYPGVPVEQTEEEKAEEEEAENEIYVFSSLSSIARCYIEQALEDFELSPAETATLVEEIFNSGLIQQGIEHHAEKVMERGFCDGRLDARSHYMCDDWRIEGRDEFAEEIAKAAQKHGIQLSSPESE